MRLFVVLAMLLIPVVALAEPREAAHILLAKGGAQNLLSQQDGARISSKQAASKVKKKYQSSRILSINLIKGRGPAVYKIKTLSASGVVKYVFVDGTSGDFFE